LNSTTLIQQVFLILNEKNYFKTLEVSTSVIKLHVSQGSRYRCLMVIVIACDATLLGWNLRKTTRLKLLDN